MPLKTISLIIISLIVVISHAQSISINANIVNYDKIKRDIEIYVNNEILIWQAQGKFEGTNSYLKRVNSTTRAKKVVEFTDNKINSIARDRIIPTIESSEYDPDNEIYELKIIGLPAIYLNVPTINNEANSFDNNINSITFLNPVYALTEKGFMLIAANIYNPINYRTYYYNYKNKIHFKKNDIQLSFDPIKIITSDYKINVDGQNQTAPVSITLPNSKENTRADSSSVRFILDSKKNIAVIGLDPIGISINNILALEIRVSSEIFKTGKFNLLERKKMNEILAEQGFQLSGCTDEACMVQAGKLLNVELIAGGTISKVGEIYSIDLRIIDVETGQIIAVSTRDIKGTIEDVLTIGVKESVANLIMYD